MSYDVWLVKLRAGLSREEAEQLLAAEYQRLLREANEDVEDEEEESEDDFAPLNIADKSLAAETFDKLLMKPYVRQFVDPELLSEEQKAWLADDSSPLPPKGMTEDIRTLDDRLDIECDPGARGFPFAHRWELLGPSLRRFAAFAREMCQHHPFLIFDDATYKLYDPFQDEERWLKEAKAAVDEHAQDTLEFIRDFHAREGDGDEATILGPL